MRALRPRGFSLVEVAISTTVMASAALLLGAALGASNGQKATARRMGLAKSLAVRQLELVQQRLNESIDGNQIVNMAGANPTLRLAALRGVGTYNINHAPNTPHYYCYQNDLTLPLTPSAGRSVLVAPTSVFHVLFPSTTVATPTPPGSMLPDELARIGVNGEQLGVQLFFSAVQTDGHVDNPPLGATPAGQAQLPVQMRQPELILAQVVVNDLSNNAQLFTLSRMYRVQSAAVFILDGQF